MTAFGTDGEDTVVDVRGSFAAAHEPLGPDPSVDGFTAADLDPAFFEPGLRRHLGDETVTVVTADPVVKPLGSSIISELSSGFLRKFAGILPYRLAYRDGAGVLGALDVIVKVKPLDVEINAIASAMATAYGEPLASAWAAHADRLPFTGAHVRELAMAASPESAIVAHRPATLQVLHDDAREAYVIVEECLGDDVVLKDCSDTPERWTRDDIDVAIRGVAECHAVHYNRVEDLRGQPWLAPVIGLDDMIAMRPLWHGLTVHAARQFPSWFEPCEVDSLLSLIADIPRWWGELAGHPMTLVHNDFSLRNIGLRVLPDGSRSLVAWDWELATVHLPQHDLAELLVFALPVDVDAATVTHHVDLHRRALAAATGVSLDGQQWRRGYQLCLYDLAVNRIPLYLLGHTFREYGFVEHVVRAARRLVHLELEREGRRLPWT